jgi:hypothetical protein
MQIQTKSAPIVFVTIILGAVALVFMTENAFYIAAPIVACIVVVLWLCLKLWDRSKVVPFFDIGVFCALATLIYSVYPLINYWVDGFRFGSLSDYRLQQYYIAPAELGFFHLRHVLYLCSFVIFYLAYRGDRTAEVGNISIPSRSAQHIIILFVVILTGYFLLLQILTGVNYNSSYESEARNQHLSAVQNLPLIIVQISGKLGGILFLFKLSLLFIVVSRCMQRRWLIILLAWIITEIIQTFLLKGARTSLVLFLMASALFYHRMIKPFSVNFLISSGVLFFIFFIFLGLYRSYADFSSLSWDLSQAEGGIFSGSNEFQALFGTAFDVYRLKEAGVYLPWYLYINDFITILPPQQLLPFEKVAASEWYLRQLGLSGTGQGYMWGVITQAIIGLDWWELVLRGAVLGYILAQLHRWYIKHQNGFLETLVYVFFCLKIYYTFRDTTFSLLANLVWELIPFYLLLRLGEKILSRHVNDIQQHNTNRMGVFQMS